ncbi:uncharacterized protein LOC129592258 [Paramacrobiotus metropolitanus]|uniref:uncharacterized protein LOC129592258 n=1 Tax=Paramacrobiotus metropolitanus TaxID=2943436 RepID=UPI002445EC30|nr:uncharacterized protein LOC129592258 [Paramacrobiotus metropolitanus]
MYELDEQQFFEYFRMSAETFDELLGLLESEISHSQTHAQPVSERQRLALTLRILAHGITQKAAAQSFCLGTSTVNQIYRETCAALWKILRPICLPPPSEEMWKKSAFEFNKEWQFPNCIGAIDGKHVQIKKPRNGGSQYINYKGTHSIVLMAVVGPDYRFLYVDIGGYGRQSDGGTWRNCSLGKALGDGSLLLPQPERPLLCQHLMPHVFVADAAFPMSVNLMRPYPDRKLTRYQRIYNYRHCRARRVSENGFGILAARFRIFRRPMDFEPEQVVLTVQGAVVLHNFLSAKSRQSQSSSYVSPTMLDRENEDGTGVTPGEWRRITAGDSGLAKLRGGRSNQQANLVRNRFCEYFNTAGSVSWQDIRAFGMAQADSGSDSEDDQ